MPTSPAGVTAIGNADASANATAGAPRWSTIAAVSRWKAAMRRLGVFFVLALLAPVLHGQEVVGDGGDAPPRSGFAAARASWAKSPQSNDTRWLPVPQGRGTELDLRSAQGNGRTVTVWQRRPLAKGEVRGHSDARQRLSYDRFDCTTRNALNLSFVLYDEAGATIDSGSDVPLGLQQIVPGSVGEAVYDFVCG
jgi:hypothetical protein